MVGASNTKTRKNLVIYGLVIIVSMFVSFATKRGLFHGQNAVKTTLNSRFFSFSSKSWSSSQYSEQNPRETALVAGEAVNGDSTYYDIAVAYNPKDREEAGMFKKKREQPSAAMLSPTGEDNLFVSRVGHDGYVALGVADGVGGWSEAGYDSSAISRELCLLLQSNFELMDNHRAATPKQLLSRAFSQVLDTPKVEIGGTTACVGILTPDHQLKIANLGDSWCGLFRDYKLVSETKFQTHNFNTPYQLAKIPEHIIRQAQLQNRKYIIDKPESADEYVWDLKSNDIIMFATDGVTDNVIPQDIEIFLKDTFEASEKATVDATSKSFVEQVVKVSKDTHFPSAFAQELSRLTGQKYLGGKEDDITVILVKVK